ncbi:unnamed protein product [Sphagnum jensenii]|uniref:DEK-C domain-containing protein n=1 Tax=Sphagnum jensenii TaxID=128206 RepID=A0ABP1BE04_9BRYO
MDIDQKAKQLEAGKKTEENEKAKDDEVVKDVEGDEEEKNRTLKPRKKRPGRPKKEGAKSEEEGSTPCESSVKRKRQKKVIFPSYIDRPTRERKSIERFIASSVEKEISKDFQIKQGEGTPFKDIPNVAYKLSKISKNDEILSMLHSLLFHKRAKAAVLKQHILQFSGYVWTENQEKERSRVKEKLERYTKEGLVLLIDVLDLHLPRTGKKEELVGKVLEFLEKPHKTTDVLLEEKEQKHKVDGESSTKRGRRKPAEESDLGESAKSEDDDALEEEEEEEIEKKHFTFKDEDHEEDSDSHAEEEKKKKSAKKLSKPSSKKDSKVGQPETEVSSDYKEKEKSEAEDMPPKKSMTKTPAKLSTPESSPKASSKPVEKVYSKNAKKQNRQKETEKEKEKVKEKEKQKEERKEKEKEKGNKRNKSYMVKESKPRKSKNVPSDEKLQSEIRALLIDADFSKVTFTDVITQLEGKFGVSLTEHKTHVKKLIKEEIKAEVEAKASPRGEAEVSQQVAPEFKTDVTEEVEDMVLEPGTTQKPGPEPTLTVVPDTKENAQLDLGTELELKTAANETERI